MPVHFLSVIPAHAHAPSSIELRVRGVLTVPPLGAPSVDAPETLPQPSPHQTLPSPSPAGYEPQPSPQQTLPSPSPAGYAPQPSPQQALPSPSPAGYVQWTANGAPHDYIRRDRQKSSPRQRECPLGMGLEDCLPGQQQQALAPNAWPVPEASQQYGSEQNWPAAAQELGQNTFSWSDLQPGGLSCGLCGRQDSTYDCLTEVDNEDFGCDAGLEGQCRWLGEEAAMAKCMSWLRCEGISNNVGDDWWYARGVFNSSIESVSECIDGVATRRHYRKVLPPLQAQPAPAPAPAPGGQGATQKSCISLKPELDDTWCNMNCRLTPLADSCLGYCSCPRVAVPAPSEPPVAADTPSEKRITPSRPGHSPFAPWAEPHPPRSPKENATEKAAAQRSSGPTVCTSLNPTMTNLWCDENCQIVPDANSCVGFCKCPKLKVPKPTKPSTEDDIATEAAPAAPPPSPSTKKGDKATRSARPRNSGEKTACVSLDPTTDDVWCDENCQRSPDANSCSGFCKCPESNVQAEPAQAVGGAEASSKESQVVGEGETSYRPEADSPQRATKPEPPPPEPRIIGGWTDCGPNTGLSDMAKARQRAASARHQRLDVRTGVNGVVNCTEDEKAISSFLPVRRGNNMPKRNPSYHYTWGTTAILPGTFGGAHVAPIVGSPKQYEYFWLTFGGENTRSADWAKTAEQDIIDAGARGAAFDIEGGVEPDAMMDFIKKMRSKHPHWTYVYVPNAGEEAAKIPYDTANPGVPDYVAPMLYAGNWNSYPGMDISGGTESMSGYTLLRLKQVGWPSSRIILTYQSFDAARMRQESQGGLLPLLGRLLGDYSVEIGGYGTEYGKKVQLQGPYAGVLGWPAQCGAADYRCWPGADKANIKEVIAAAQSVGVTALKLPGSEEYPPAPPIGPPPPVPKGRCGPLFGGAKCDCSVGKDGCAALYCSWASFCGDTDAHRKGGMPAYDCPQKLVKKLRSAKGKCSASAQGDGKGRCGEEFGGAKCDCSVGDDGSKALWCSGYGWCGDTEEHRQNGMPDYDCPKAASAGSGGKGKSGGDATGKGGSDALTRTQRRKTAGERCGPEFGDAACDCSVGDKGSRALYCSTYGWCGDTDEHRGGLPDFDCADAPRVGSGTVARRREVAPAPKPQQQSQQQEAECGPTVGIKCGQKVFDDGDVVREFPSSSEYSSS